MRFKILAISVFLFMLAATIGGAVAESMDTYVDQPTIITTACIRNGQMRESATATITIFDSVGGVIVPKTAMAPAGNGTFSYTYTFTSIGGYSTRETCDFGGLLADGSTMINVVKPQFGSMQVIAQGTSQIDLGKPAVSEWLILLPNSTNVTMSNLKVLGGDCGVTNINGSILNSSVSTSVTDERMTATFTADPLAGFEEGSNYQVLCNITLSQGMYVNGVKNYVYVNAHESFLQYLLQLIGLGRSTQQIANETLSISNQTLQIVSGLNITNSPTMIYEQIPVLKTGSVTGWAGVPVTATAKVLVGSSNVANAVCSISVEKAGVIVDSVNATYDAGTSLYVFNWTPSDVGSYLARWDCSGGNLSSRVVYDVSSVDVGGGVMMTAIS